MILSVLAVVSDKTAGIQRAFAASVYDDTKMSLASSFIYIIEDLT